MPRKCVFTSWCVPTRGATLAIFGCLSLCHSASRADDPDPATAKPVAAKKDAALQKAAAQQKASAALRSRRAREMRATIAYDDVFGAGAGSLAQAAAQSGGSGANSGVTSSAGYGSAFLGNGFSPALAGTGAAYSGTGTAGAISTGTGTTSPGTAGSGGSGNTPGTTFNAKILQFAHDHLGQQVGNGECWTLAEDALIYAGAKPANQYVFGDAIPLSSAQPGDILQFESVILIGANYWMVLGTPHHTAIVDQIQGSQIQMLNQNVNGILRVQYTTINLADLHSGTITAYRAVANDSATSNSDSPNGSPSNSTPPACKAQSGTGSTSVGSQSGASSKPANCQTTSTAAGTSTSNPTATTSARNQQRSTGTR